MMQTADLGEGNNVAGRGNLYATRPWAVLVEREMCSDVMMILKIARQDAAQVTLVEDDNVIPTTRPSTGRPTSFHCSIPRRRTLICAKPVCTKNSDSDVLVMQPTEQRTRDDAPNLLDRARDRSIFVQRSMSSDFIVIACVGLQGQPQVRLAQGDDMVGTLATDRSDQPFCETVLPRRSWGNGLVADAHGS